MNKGLQMTAKEEHYKRALDLMIITLAHLLLLPFWLVLWTSVPILIWLEDQGPIFYTQIRVGRGGKNFRAFKFRTMRHSMAQSEGEPTILAIPNDPRITRVGRILRSTALDELPQILNIVVGDMSFVGPRPEPPDIYEEMLHTSGDAPQRVSVRPGLTGMAQVYCGYNARLQDKLYWDLEYIRKMNPWLDMKLILLSAWKTLTGSWEAVGRTRKTEEMDKQPKLPT